ncbi:hypothetical protein HK44_020480 [Pseudomonas fluorescens HK44]|uniref:Uncharacterized protein n=1 Tax=Pseudomonas fluorescens HK44 TaxID=1042209 RepID=A0A010RU10_PSEFL|nr:hypothetical protein HK44_020480 [Pseudomonas fluorescens HK44]
MPEFDCEFSSLPAGAQQEIRELAHQLGWSLDLATEEYLLAASSIAAAGRVVQNSRKAPVLELVGHKRALDRG